MKIVIFDIDGTLADIRHRLHHIKDGGRNWDGFFEAAVDDKPIKQMIELLKSLMDYRVILVSGRPERIRKLTGDWLEKHQMTMGDYDYEDLYMRPDGDHRPDYVLKKEILGKIREDYPGEEVLFVVDDRPSVVKMWREEGLICLQCAEWKE